MAGCRRVGFQDEFDDGLAECCVLRRLVAPERRPFASFRLALNELGARHGDLRGTCIVLWTARPVLDRAPAAEVQSAARRAEAVRVLEQVRSDSQVEVREGDARDLMVVEARPCPNLNYSLLHNNRDLFQTFRIKKPKPGRIRGVEVEVVLHAGNESFPYRASVDLLEPVTELRERIRVPLTSALSRSLRESVHTVIYASVSWNGQTVYRNTERVTLLPPDEWKDDDENRIWLPSFVLPRDPAILEVVDGAERYLKALRDDRAASFDGYQSIRPGALDPSEAVDLQVQALWATLSFEQRLGYINPPPTYSASSQRLRTPTEILHGRRGTCIDLALLLAACLEYVEIYPVIFVLEGHAFPGYWRSPVDPGLRAGQAGTRRRSPGTTQAGADRATRSWQVRRSYRWSSPECRSGVGSAVALTDRAASGGAPPGLDLLRSRAASLPDRRGAGADEPGPAHPG